MSAITEYVHYNQINYDNWGINRVGTTKSETMISSFNQIRNRITNIQEIIPLIAQAKQLQNDYNNLFFPQKETDFSKLLAQVAQQTLYEQFGAAAGKINIQNFNVQSNNVASEYKKKIKEVRKKIDVANLQKDATVKQILNQINKLDQVLLNLDDNKSSLILKNRLNNAKIQLNKIKQKLSQESGLKNQNLSEDITTINKFIQQFNRSFTWYNQRGDLFEWLLPLIQLRSTNLVGDQLKKAMKNLVGSNNEGASKITIEFPDFLNMTSEQLSTSIDTKNFKMQIADVRSKTDVTIQYSTSNNQYKDIAISAKSVTGRHVKLVDETSLYRVLVFSENYDFIKHYLNIISWSKKGGKASSDQIIQANRLVKGLIMQLGAQGFDLNNPSELLIMHNVKEKKIHVYNIKALVYIIQKEIINGNSKYNNLIKSSKFNDNFTIEQQFQDTVEQRLNNVFNKINDIKLTAHIYGNQLDDYIKLLT